MSDRGSVELTETPSARFDLLFDSSYNAIFRYCARRLGPTDAEDAAADVFAVAWRRIEDMPEGDARKAWLFGVAHRVVGRQYRSRQRRNRLSARLEQTTPQGPGTSSGGEFDDLLAALDHLSRPDQEVLRLSAWDGLNRTEIATVLGIKENAVDQRLHRARARLRSRLDRLGPGSSQVSPKEAST